MKDKLFLRSAYNYDVDEASNASGLSCPEPTLAIQSEKDDADINTIVRRFGLTGQLPTNVRTPTFEDFTGVSDYQSALAAMQAADESFYQMPAEVRAKFDNDPQGFVSFCSDAANLEQLRSWGLAPVKDVPNVVPVDVVPEKV